MSQQKRVFETPSFLPFSPDWRCYFAIARIDHWFKNVFMVSGVLLAIFHKPSVLTWAHFPELILAILATCLLASSNYVLNEIQDADHDRYHPKKKFRPIPSGLINIPLAYTEWAMLAIVGLTLATFINLSFLYVSAAFLFMGFLYNVKPFRLKDLPYLDVLSESVNNPIRLLLGWFVFLPSQLPSISLLLSFWFLGAFFMATKRFAEYRTINDPQVASNYRKSFMHYTEERLLTSMVFYTSLFAFFFAIFIMKYHFELILAAPFIIGFISYYFQMGFRPNSAVQTPEHLYLDTKLVYLSFACVGILFFLLLTDIPELYNLFNVNAAEISPLWTF